MHIIDKVLQEASTLGIVVDHGTSNRAWVKAACLFIEHYVLSTISTSTIQDSNLLEEVLSVFLKKVRFCRMQEQESNGNKVDSSSMRYDLPTCKPFITISRLIDKYSATPVHSHYNLLSGGKTRSSHDCNHENWNCIPGIVVGILKPGEAEKEIVLSDKSGCIPVHMINMKYDYLHTVCLLMTWNYVPDSNKKAGYIEILDDPVVLKRLKSDKCPGQIIFIPSLGFDCGEMASSTTHIEEQFAISGYVNSMACKSSTCASLCLDSQPYWKRSLIMYNDSCVENFDIIGNVELSISFLPLLSFGCMVKITHLEKMERLSSTATFTATASTRITISHQAEKLLSLSERKDECLIAINDACKTSNSILSFYAGKVSKIVSENHGIILLDGGELMVFLLGYRGSYHGFREGAIIALKNFHLCLVNQRPAAVCCVKLSSIEVLKHSNLPTHSFVLKHDEFSEILQRFHPSTVCSLLLAYDYIFPHVPTTAKENLLKEDWFKNLFLHQQSDENSVEDSCSGCSGKQVLFNNPQFIKCASLKMLHDVVLGEAQKLFGSNTTTWKSSIFHCKDIFEKCFYQIGTNTPVCIGAILVSASSGLKLFDGKNSLKCLILPSNCSFKGTLYEKSEDYWRKFSSFNIDCIGSLVKINDFWLVVEAKAGSSVNTTNSSLRQSSVYLVTSISSIEILTSNTTHPRLTKREDFYKQANKDDCAFTIPSSSHFKDSIKTKQHSCLLFIMHKGPLLNCIGKRCGFSITTLKYSSLQPPVECHVQFSGKTAKYYSLLHPAMLIEINFEGKDGTAFDKCIYYNSNCSLQHICDFKDSHNFTSSESEAFHNCAYQEWKKKHFSQGILSIYKAHELYMCPPTKLPQLVAVCGTITQRIECKSGTFSTLDQHYFILSLSTLNSCIVYVKVRLRENHQQCLLGLLPGAFVTFYRVKCLLSLQGDIYCLCTPTSFHVVHHIDMARNASLSVSLFNNSENNLTNLSASRCFLYNVYEKQCPEDKYKVIQVKAHVIRLLSVRLEAVNGGMITDRDISSRRTFYERNGLYEGEQPDDTIIFQAKCVVSDGSARIILYVNKQQDFCDITEIDPEEWNDLIALLKQSSSKSLNYDCNVHDGKEVFRTETDEAGFLAIALFNDINSGILPSRNILIRHRPLCRKRPWNSNFVIDDSFVDLVNEESLFRVGTVALEGQGSTSLRSISRRLLQFSCLAVK